MRNIGLGLLIFACAARASIVTQTMCTATGFASVTNPTSCSIPTNASPSADTAASIAGSLAVNAGGVNAQFSNLQIRATPTVSNTHDNVASASATGSESILLGTSGPVRPGFLFVFENIELNDFGDPETTGTADITIGSLSAHCASVNATPSFTANCSGSLGAFNGIVMGHKFPVMLGQLISFSDDISMIGSEDVHGLAIDGLAEGLGSLNFSFSFLDANGNPVQMYVVPEPGTWALVLLSGLAGAVIRCAHSRLKHSMDAHIPAREKA